MRCHECRHSFRRYAGAAGVYWRCPGCRGAMFPFSYLQRAKDGEAVWSFIGKPPRHRQLSRRPCPVCFERMELALTGGGSRELDICRRCSVAWFDPFEVDGDRGSVRLFPPPPTRSGGAALAVKDPVIGESGATWEENPTIDVLVLTTLALPEEENETPRGPVWAVYAVLAAVFVLGTAGVPAGAVFWWPLVCNLYFLHLYGDNVEDLLGPWHFLELVGLSAAVGALAVRLALGPSVGFHPSAGSVVAGLMVVYLFAFPRAKFSVFPFIGGGGRASAFSPADPHNPVGVLRLRFPAAVFGAVFLALSLWLASVEVAARAPVAGIGILGGATAGFLYWLLYGPTPRPRRKRAGSR